MSDDLMKSEPIHCAWCDTKIGERRGGNWRLFNVEFEEGEDGEMRPRSDIKKIGEARYRVREYCGECGHPIVSELTNPENYFGLSRN